MKQILNIVFSKMVSQEKWFYRNTRLEVVSTIFLLRINTDTTIVFEFYAS
jgi:hypothetical protein